MPAAWMPSSFVTMMFMEQILSSHLWEQANLSQKYLGKSS